MLRVSIAVPRRRAVVDAVLIVGSIGYGCLLQPELVNATPLDELGPVALVTATVAISSIWWLRRSAPEWFAVLAVVSTLLCDLTGALPPLALATIAVRRRLTHTLIAGVSMAAVVLIQVWLEAVPDPVPVAVGTVVLFAAAAGWGIAVRNRREVERLLRAQVEDANRSATEKAAAARREERARIARDMHDTLAHRMSLLAIQGAAIEQRADAASPDVRELAQSMRGAARNSLEDLRWMMEALREVDDVELHPPVDPRDVRRLVDEAGLLGDVEIDVRPGWSSLDDLPAPIGHVLYRVVQEALTNARKHGGGGRVRVAIVARPEVQVGVEVTDCQQPTSVGVPPPRVGLPGTGRGLLGLEERARAVGGQVEHGAGADGAFMVRATLPWFPEAAR